MADALYPDDPTEFMQALGPIMIAGTTVGASSWFVQKGVNAATAQFPVLILNCPDTEHVIVGLSMMYQATFNVEALYLDRWESSARSFEQCLADAETAVYRMARNIRATPDLGMTFNVAGHSQGKMVQANNHIRIRLGTKPTDDPGLGFALINAQLSIQVLGPYFNV